MSSLSRSALLSIVAAGLAACAGTTKLDYSYISDNYAPYILGYAAGKGGIPTEVAGNPFGTSKAQLDSQVAQTFTDNHFGPDVDFLTTVPEDFRSPYRVVVLLNPAPHANGVKLCSSDERPQVEAGQGVGVLASFCTSDQRINSVSGSLGLASGPDDPAFRELMARLSLELFPPRSPNRSDRNSEFF